MTSTLAKTPNCCQIIKGLSLTLMTLTPSSRLATKFEVINVQKLKLFLEEEDSETDTHFKDLNFNDVQFNSPITRTHTKLINYKNAVQVALSILKNREETENEIDIFSMCEILFDQSNLQCCKRSPKKLSNKIFFKGAAIVKAAIVKIF
jgi:hypothetical protein